MYNRRKENGLEVFPEIGNHCWYIYSYSCRLSPRQTDTKVKSDLIAKKANIIFRSGTGVENTRYR